MSGEMLFLGRLSTILLAAAFLSGCQTAPTDCNPGKGGLIDGVSGLMSGCYEQRVDQKHETLSSTQRLTQQLQANNRQLQQEKQLTAAYLTNAEHQLAALERDNGRLEQTLGQMHSNTAAQRAEKARLQQDLQQINGEIAAVRHRAQSGQLSEEQLQPQIEKLTQRRDQLASDIAAASVVR